MLSQQVVYDSATLWTVAQQAPLSMGSSRNGYCSGLPFPSPGNRPEPGIKLASPVSSALAGEFFTAEPPGKPLNLPYYSSDVQAGFRKGRGTRDQIANIRWIIEKQESSGKTYITALRTLPKALTAWITINCGKF